jgi:peroxiredoxin Q/BCP
MLKIGSAAPEVTITTHTGYHGPLSKFWEDKSLVLFFYPKDATTVCTKEACAIQNGLDQFNELSANVLGSSTDSVKSHEKFAADNSLAYPLIADTNGEVAKAFDAFRSLLKISKRITYVIGTDGKIKAAVHSELSAHAHFDGAMKALRKIS